MIPPRSHWAVQIAVTSMCWPHTGTPSKRGPLTGCSNCTRLLAHEKKRYVMTPEQFRVCAEVAAEWAYNSPPCVQGRIGKIVGIFGGEALMSPYFAEYVDIACEVIPDAAHRGLWTSYDWTQYESPKWGKAAPLVHKLLGSDGRGGFAGFLNWNMHGEDQVCEHHPVLKSVSFMVPDEKRRMELINECWLNRDWSAAYALDHNGEPKFYFCELASSFDRVMHLGVGLPVEKGVWNHDLPFVRDEDGILRPGGVYANQIMASCLRCGQPLPQKIGRRDLDFKDDISPDNLVKLLEIGSPMVERGDYVEASADEVEQYDESRERDGYRPMQYIKRGKIHSSVVKKA